MLKNEKLQQRLVPLTVDVEFTVELGLVVEGTVVAELTVVVTGKFVENFFKNF